MPSCHWQSDSRLVLALPQLGVQAALVVSVPIARLLRWTSRHHDDHEHHHDCTLLLASLQRTFVGLRLHPWLLIQPFL